MAEYYGRRRFEFYKAGLKTVRLPGVMCGPVFMAAYDIARLCQTPFTPVVRHPDWAAKLNALAKVIFGTPEFERLRPQTVKRYKAWLREFQSRIGGRCYPALRYMEITHQYRARPTKAALRKLCGEFRQLVAKAAGLNRATEEPQVTPLFPKAQTASIPHIRHDVRASLAELRKPHPLLSPDQARRKYMRDRLRSFAAKERQLTKYPRHMQIVLRKAWRELWPPSDNVIGSPRDHSFHRADHSSSSTNRRS